MENSSKYWSAPFSSLDENLRLDVPRRGHVLTTVTEKYSRPIREAVQILAHSFVNENADWLHNLFFFPPHTQPVPEATGSHSEIAAWSLVSIWIVGVGSRIVPPTTGLSDAEKWFFRGVGLNMLTRFFPEGPLDQAEKALQQNPDTSAYYQLLPYILDPHGPGSRLSVIRDPRTHAARERKRVEGVFYTPADVAEYMATGCIDSIEHKNKAPTVFDPACGTGVFLKAALKALKQRYPHKNILSLATECLFGTDIDPWPLNATAFVLLAEIITGQADEIESPAEIWRQLRLNLACVDTLQIDPAREVLANIDNKSHSEDRISITGLFPKLTGNPALVIGNPPYADIGNRSDMEQLSCIFQTLDMKPRANADIYPIFIEQMTRLANREQCAGALVLPLSIACNIGWQFMAARKLMQNTTGRWRFAFFDREPHALFGEDVKTRNTILIWSRNKSERSTVFESGPLQKWRGNDRSAMFQRIRHTEFDGDIYMGIPKFHGASQATALQVLGSRWNRLEQAVLSIERMNLEATSNADDRIIFVGPTAYNFLNVLLRPPSSALEEGATLSENPLYAIRCASVNDTFILFGILTSHFAYWWWHVHGDGFHVSRRFISEFPFGLDVLGAKEAEILRECGIKLWSAIKNNPVISKNRGRISIAYSPNGYADVRQRADEALASFAGLDTKFVDELQQFNALTVAADLRDYGYDNIKIKEHAYA